MCFRNSLGLHSCSLAKFNPLFCAEEQAGFCFFLDAVHRGWCYAMSFALSEWPQNLRSPLITPVPSLKHSPTCFFSELDCTSSALSVASLRTPQNRRTASVALIRGAMAPSITPSIAPESCCNWVLTDYFFVGHQSSCIFFSIFVKPHIQIFQFLWQLFSSWSHDADMQIGRP